MLNYDAALQEKIAALETTDRDVVPVEEVREILTGIKNMLHAEGLQGGDFATLYKELGELARFINEAKKEMQDNEAGKLTDEDIPDASNQLDAIVQMTEEATDKIMDNCERLQAFHSTIRERLMAEGAAGINADILAGVDDALNDAQTSITHIFEACNFQDITGQRIQKVVKVLREIERHVLRMVVVFGLSHKENLDEETRHELEEDVELLNGPALSGQGLEQDDVDDLLDKLL